MIPIKASAAEATIVPVLEAPKYRRKMRAPISQKVDLFFVHRSEEENAPAPEQARTRPESEQRRALPQAPGTRGPGMILDAVA